MNFLRTLGILLLVSLYAPLMAQQPLTKDALTKLGIYEGSRLRIRNAAGDANTWGWAQAEFKKIFVTQLPTGQHFFNIKVNPQNIAEVLGYGNLGSLFIVRYQGDKIALKVKVFGGGGYNASQNVDKYVDNPYFGINPVYFDVIPQQAPTAGTGSYVVAFRKGTGTAADPYAYLNVGTAASNSAQYFTIDILDAKRDDAASRGTPLIYENSCYQIFIAGTPLNVWVCGVNYGNGKTLNFGNITFRTGITDDRPSSTAAAMCILSGKNQSQLSAGTINYGDSIRIIGLHTVLSAAVNTYDEIYPWRQCSIGNTIVGWVTQSNQNFVTADDPAQVFIVTSALIPGTSTAIYDEHTPVCANDAIRLVPYWNTTSTSTYPYANSTNLWFWSNLTDPQHSGMYWNSNQPYDQTYNLFSLKRLEYAAADPNQPNVKMPNLSALTSAKAQQYGPLLTAWDSSTTFAAQQATQIAAQKTAEKKINTDLTAAATAPSVTIDSITAAINTALAAIAAPPINSKILEQASLGAIFVNAFIKAISLAATTPHCTTIQGQISAVAKLFPTVSFATVSTVLTQKSAALAAQAAQRTAETKINTDLTAATAATSVTIASITKAISDALTAIAASPINSKLFDQASLGATLIAAFTKAISLAAATTDCATIQSHIAAAAKLFPTISFATVNTALTQKSADLAVLAAQQAAQIAAQKAAETKINLDLSATTTSFTTIGPITKAINKALTAIAAPPINSKLLDQATLGATFISVFTKAISLATITTDCTTIQSQVAIATPLFPTISFAAVSTALTQKSADLVAQAEQQAAEARINANLAKITAAPSVSIGSMAAAIATALAAIAAAPINSTLLDQATLGATFINAFNKTISLASSATDPTKIQAQIATAAKLFPSINFDAVNTALINKTTEPTPLPTPVTASTPAPAAQVAPTGQSVATAAAPIPASAPVTAPVSAKMATAPIQAIASTAPAAQVVSTSAPVAAAAPIPASAPVTATAPVSAKVVSTSVLTTAAPKPVAPTKAQITQLQNSYSALEKARKDAVAAASKLTGKTKTAANIDAKYSTVITKAVSILQTTPAVVTAAYATNTTIKQTCNYVVRSIYGIFTDTNLFNKTTKKLGITSLKTSLQNLQTLIAQFPGETTYKTAIAQAKF